MTLQTFAHAFIRIAQRTPESEHDALLERLHRFLEARGRSASYGAILTAARTALVAAREKRGGIVYVSKTDDIERYRAEAAQKLATLGAEGTPTFSVDQTLVSGYVAVCGSQRYDASGKRGLVSLYHHLLTHS